MGMLPFGNIMPMRYKLIVPQRLNPVFMYNTVQSCWRYCGVFCGKPVILPRDFSFIDSDVSDLSDSDEEYIPEEFPHENSDLESGSDDDEFNQSGSSILATNLLKPCASASDPLSQGITSQHELGFLQCLLLHHTLQGL
ncbi:Uncharacterised protein r2_g1423 [Pycnogonum litorale]